MAEKNYYSNGIDAFEGQPYSWSQTPHDVTITVKLDPPAGAKEMEVVVSPERLKVRRRAAPANECIIDGKITKPHRIDDSNWWIDDRKLLTIELKKIKRSEWWMSVIEGHKEISWDSLQPEHPTYAEDLDGETQALVKKMMFDNQQRQRGLPTSEELEKRRILEEFQAKNPNVDLSQIMNQQDK